MRNDDVIYSPFYDEDDDYDYADADVDDYNYADADDDYNYADADDVSYHSAVVLVTSLYAIVATENTKSNARSKFVFVFEMIIWWICPRTTNVITIVAYQKYQMFAKTTHNTKYETNF